MLPATESRNCLTLSELLMFIQVLHKTFVVCCSPPQALIEADFSFNEIETIKELREHKYIKKLNLNNNNIKKITGLSELTNLMDLRLNNNFIEEIENVEGLNLAELHLQGNLLKFVSGLHKLPKLRVLNISRNQIAKLKGLRDLLALRTLLLSDNKVNKIRELTHIEHLEFLSVLDLCFNPVQKRRFYRFQVLFKIPHLRCLDGVNVTAEEIVKAENLYGIDVEERRRIFKIILPEEDFIDRRLNTAELIEPETDSDTEDMNFMDQYDSCLLYTSPSPRDQA
eukprot:TRINITY_DN4709_c0_g1_i1.p1 TRINITY_DN4709_c0_g1~~TRINITY_DN4709_c0_g1_i1.p1  ORF type:complete len:282 (-),score=57.79 TRINITY_DN4709_c0_g1_i1:38-883(-)